MADFLKGVLVTVLVIIYVVCPDFFPGPIDDFAVIVLAIMSTVGNRSSGYIED